MKGISYKETLHDKFIIKLTSWGLIILLFISAGNFIDADWTQAMANRQQVALFLNGFLQPEWNYWPKLIEPLIETLNMSIAGTGLGVITAIPAAFFGTSHVTKNNWITRCFRSFFNLIRTLPNLLLAALFVAIIGIGSLTGMLTIAVFTFGMVSQLIVGQIETIDIGPLQATESIGASRIQLARTAIWPQIDHSVYAYTLYALEVNIRSSVVLGYVGAGGIGVLLNTALSFMQFGRVSLIILVILIVVTIVNLISNLLRKALI